MISRCRFSNFIPIWEILPIADDLFFLRKIVHTLSESRTAVHYSSCLFSSTKVFSLPHPWAVTEKNIYKGWQKDPWLMDSQINQNFPIMFFVTLHLLEMVLAPWKFDIDRTGLWFGKDETRFWRSLRSLDALPWCTTWQPRRHSDHNTIPRMRMKRFPKV